MREENLRHRLTKEPVKEDEVDEDDDVERPPSSNVINEGGQIFIKVPPIMQVRLSLKPLPNVLPSIVSLEHSSDWHREIFSKKSRQLLNTWTREHSDFYARHPQKIVWK